VVVGHQFRLAMRFDCKLTFCHRFRSKPAFGGRLFISGLQTRCGLSPLSAKTADIAKRAAAVAAGQLTTYKLRFHLVAMGTPLCRAPCCCSC
jgi:hypothetical protein